MPSNDTGSGIPSPPAVTLPRGGGAIRGIGEKFAANPALGTGSTTVPIFTSPGRLGFGPQLSLSYDSGAGNGPFGLGWTLSLPSITRKTDKGLPQYEDDRASDVFIMSGVEDLVPTRDDPAPARDGWIIQRYRPRVEGLFARIERWTSVATGDVHWRSITRDNIVTMYGRTAESRVADPANPRRVFTWLICETYDDRGNVVAYEYKRENSERVETGNLEEANRTDASRSAARYVKRIRYGNVAPHRPGMDVAGHEWRFDVVFDYGEHYSDDGDATTVSASDDRRAWDIRQDPFSTFRAGFEIRMYRLCRRVLMFHHFPRELGVADCLVRATHFTYRETPIASFLAGVTQSGYVRTADTYVKRSLPSLDFEYTTSALQQDLLDRLEGIQVDAQSLENLPMALAGGDSDWVDLDGEGLSGVLEQYGQAWYYKRNLSAERAHQPLVAPDAFVRFAPLERVASLPVPSRSVGGPQFLDLAADGQLDVVHFDRPAPGYFERTHDDQWEAFVPFHTLPNVSWRDPNLRFLDLTGDGHVDVLIAKDDVFTWYPSLAEGGFGEPRQVRQSDDETKGPRLVFADGTESIYLADMSGDGLTDLVRIRNGDVTYWPNLGYGGFGAKIAMSNAPLFDRPGEFDQARARLADIDGSGVTDIVYIGADRVDVYFNCSGNSWSARRTIVGLPCMDNLSSIVVVDLLGNGTACLVWSSIAAAHASRHMRYVDLMNGLKPHLLVKTRNNLGAETMVHYAPSTKFYLEDKRHGRPWITRLPFPVHVVERVETYDRISRSRFVTRYAYHHGYFDGTEREFRGFGLVEQWDTETYSALTASPDSPSAENVDPASHVPPVLTKTWFHTGAYVDGADVGARFATEYYKPDAGLLDDTVLPPGLSANEEREACRALKGALLRQEVFGLDDSPASGHPYTVSERNYTVTCLQPRGENRHAVFFVHPRERVDYQYERRPDDPRITHTLTFAVDRFGNILKSAAIAYGRRLRDPELSPEEQAAQAMTFVTYTENAVTNGILDDADAYRAPLTWEARTHELTELSLAPDGSRMTLAALRSAIASAAPIAYEESPTPSVAQRRLIEHERAIFRRDDLQGALPPGQLQPMALPFDTYKAALTPGLVTRVFGDRVADDVLRTEGGYQRRFDDDANWWVPSGEVFFSSEATDAPAAELAYAQRHFFLPHRFRDPFGSVTSVTYAYDLLVDETRDALGNRVRAAEQNYRVLQPAVVVDANGNRSAAAFDALGMVVATAVMGKVSENTGDSLDGIVADLSEDIAVRHLTDPSVDPHRILQKATARRVYDLFAYQRTQNDPDPQPSIIYTLTRETHASALAPGERTNVQHQFSYSDGFGREIQKKVQAERGPVRDGGPDVNPRWVGSGWVIFNNKGLPVRQYEPFFSETHRFEFNIQRGVSAIAFYDPPGRIVGTLHPNHTWQKTTFDAWRQEVWDVNDTVLEADPRNDRDVGGFFRRLADSQYLPTWYQQHAAATARAVDRDAAAKAVVHASTPTVTHLDPLGRPFLSIAHNTFRRSADNASRPAERYRTRMLFDIEGNQKAIIDANGRLVMRFDYDMLATRVHETSMEAGERWTLVDVRGAPIRAWDTRRHVIRHTYDVLRRPTRVFLTVPAAAEALVEETVYGEEQGDARNHRGRIFQHFDSAGVVTNTRYDFKGNLTEARRQLTAEYKRQIDWLSPPALSEVFDSRTDFDALNRPVQTFAPDGSVIRPTYNEANLLEQVNVRIRGAAASTSFVTDIDYNARGQRVGVAYGNGIRTDYTYDDLTFRLATLRTTRDTGDVLQDLAYTYDPAGNVTQIRDAAQQTLYFRNSCVTAACDYTYDATYRLVEAKGREHLGQLANGAIGPVPTSQTDYPRVGLAHPGDCRALARYVEQYEHDAVGNLMSMIHQPGDAAQSGWTRTYTYSEPSALEPDRFNNRLTRTTTGDDVEEYRYDGPEGLHGNITGMTPLPLMRWDYRDQLQASSRQVTAAGVIPETTYYVYDASGQRMRKVTERQASSGAPTRAKERIYVGGFEIYREYAADGTTVTVERQTLPVTAASQRVALVETKTIDTTVPGGTPRPSLIRYQLDNHLGSACIEVDQRGAVISYEEYYPFGSTSYQGVRADLEVPPKRYRYTGQERDEESGLSYQSARYYAPWIGRWTACDPALLVDGTNPYQYARSRPTVLIDRSGRQSETSPAAAGFWTAIAQYARADLERAAGMAFGLGEIGLAFGVKASLHSAAPWLDQYLTGKAMNETYMRERAEGYSVRSSLFQIVNEQANPVYGGLTSGYSSFQAELKGEHFESGRQTSFLGVNLVSLAGLAWGGVSLARSLKIPGTAGTPLWTRASGEVSGTWNEFQAATRGRFRTRAAAGEAWAQYREIHGIGRNAAAPNTTRAGVRRSTMADWRRIRNLWDEFGEGYSEILSEANRRNIARGRVPRVDEAWVRAFPDSARFVGERIPIHHVRGSVIHVPLSESQHTAAHMPGGTSVNPGGPGEQF